MGMPDISNGYHLVFPNTIEGKLKAREEYKKNLKQELIQLIKNKYKIDFFLDPPTAPKIDINNLYITHFRGNLQSNIVVIFVTDFTCENCRAAYPVLEKIFEKYKSRVKFGFTHFSPNVTLASICSEAANVQGKFWEYQHSVFSTTNLKTNDTLELIDIASRLGLNVKRFKQDMFEDSIRNAIEKNIEILKAKRIYATPTILLNGTVILDVFDQNKIQKLLDEAIDKK
jgi:protein-disulfide isomerase